MKHSLRLKQRLKEKHHSLYLDRPENVNEESIIWTLGQGLDTEKPSAVAAAKINRSTVNVENQDQICPMLLQDERGMGSRRRYLCLVEVI